MAMVPPGGNVSQHYTTPSVSTGSSGGGFFDGFKLKDAMPFAAAGLSGILAGRTADNYGRSMLAAQGVTADAALGTAMINANLGKDMARFGLNLDQQAAQRNLALQRSGPFRDLLATRAAMGESGPGFEERAAARMRMFG
jgi:hypothetical protein